MQRVKRLFGEKPMVQWFDLEPLTDPSVPETCSRRCQCKEYFPCSNPDHNPCSFKIGFEANHTHIQVEIPLNGTIKLRKICISPKCLGNFDEVPVIEQYRGPLPTPPVRCYICYYRIQKKLDIWVARSNEDSPA